jgi:hypothetical protein
MIAALAALALMTVSQMADGTTQGTTAPAPTAQPSSAQQGLDVNRDGLRQQLAEDGTDFAVPLDWAGPAARRPGADEQVREFDPAASLFGTNAGMCVVQRGQPLPDCARADAPGTGREVTLGEDVFAGGISNPDATCQTIESVRRGADGRPERVFATVCGDEAEMWNYRQRTTPSSERVATRPTERDVGPNDVSAPRNPPTN